ncbi:MAG: FtsX-like permease family protein, partial [Clostridia bacterium]
MSLGVKRRQVFMHILVSVMCVVIISSLGGGAVGYFMYDDIVGRIYEEAKAENVNLEFSSYKTETTISGTYDSSIIENFDLKRSPDTVILIGGIQLTVLSIAAVIMAREYSKMEPLVLIKGLSRKGRKNQ